MPINCTPNTGHTGQINLGVILCMLCVVSLLPLSTGCDRDQSATPQAKKRTPPKQAGHEEAKLPATPSQTVARIHQHRQAGEYKKMLDLIVPEHRNSIQKMTLSVDQLIAAEKVLQETIARVIGEGGATKYKQRTQVANILGPLSRDVTIISEEVSDDQAKVTIQVAGRVPLEQVNLRRENDQWLMISDDPIPGLAEEIQNLARSVRHVASEVDRRKLSREEMEREISLRQDPVMLRIAQLLRDRKKSAENPAPTNENG